MAVVTMNTLSTARWNRAVEELTISVETTEDERLNDLLLRSRAQHDLTGHPCQIWADHIAAIQVIAVRRAELSATIRSRVLNLTAAEAAERLLALADDIHQVRPGDEAVATLARVQGDRQLF